MSLEKTEPKIFFIADLKTCWVFQGFEQLSSAITAGVMQLLRHVKTARFRLIFRYNILECWQRRC